MLSKTKSPARHVRRRLVRAVVLVAVPALVLALGATGRPHAAHAPSSVRLDAGSATPPPGSAADLAAGEGAPVCLGSVCPLPKSLGSVALTRPAFEALDFVEESGSISSIPFDRVCALSINAPRTVCVIEGPFYQAVIEGANLEPLYRQIQKRQIGTLKADSLANGDTYSVPVVPMAQLMELSKAKASGAATSELTQVDSILQAPVIGRVRVVPNVPFHFDGRSGAYVSDGGDK